MVLSFMGRPIIHGNIYTFHAGTSQVQFPAIPGNSEKITAWYSEEPLLVYVVQDENFPTLTNSRCVDFNGMDVAEN